MLGDDLLRRRYLGHLNLLCELAQKEVERTRYLGPFHETARLYRDRFLGAREDYENRWHRDLVGAFSRLQDAGRLEIITSAATHGYLPLLRVNPQAVRAQVQVAAQHYAETFGRPARGIWLPECGFYPGLDQELGQAGLRYFFVDTHGVHHATGRPAMGVYAPIHCPSGVAAFGRDPDSSKQVWSSQEGYPGDPDYREFYRDIGFDLDYEYIKPYIHKDGIRVNTGIKYYRITGRTHQKEPYVRAWALHKADLHAGNFMFNRHKQAEWLRGGMNRRPIIVAPYDAELFGHWWFEGPEWIDLLFRKIAAHPSIVKLVTPPEYLAEHSSNQTEMPAASSWGHKGYNEVWLNGSNDWLYRHLHEAADRMVELANRFPEASGLRKRALDQAARELLLAQASDWAFIMKTGTTVPYAVKRTKEHLLAFTDLYEGLVNGGVSPERLSTLETRNNIFPNLDYQVYQTRGPGAS
jgi:1,4-alpha-glucan branching enzyme